MIEEFQSKLNTLQDSIKNNKEQVRLLIVTKSQEVKKIKYLVDLNCKMFGENYVEEGIEKIKQMQQTDLEWHFIGKIQSNKIKKIVMYFDWIQTLSSEKHAIIIDKECEKLCKIMNVCIQINIDNEETKGGIKLSDLELFYKKISLLKNIKIKGLMAIPKKLNTLKESSNSYSILRAKFNAYKHLNNDFDTLSIGMTNDFEVAIKHGSNMIRMGTYFFGDRKK